MDLAGGWRNDLFALVFRTVFCISTKEPLPKNGIASDTDHPALTGPYRAMPGDIAGPISRTGTLEISTNAERHIQQIREIKNNPNFPRR